jgi:hypothetical protein
MAVRVLDALQEAPRYCDGLLASSWPPLTTAYLGRKDCLPGRTVYILVEQTFMSRWTWTQITNTASLEGRRERWAEWNVAVIVALAWLSRKRRHSYRSK